MSKFEKLLDLLVNEQKDEAEKVLHEIVVEKARQIYEGILADDEANAETATDAEEVEEASDKDEDAETEAVDEAQDDDVDEAMHGDDKKKKKKKMEDEVDESEETEETDESAEETIEEIGGDATDDLISDIEAEAEGDDMADMGDENGDMDMDGDGDADPEAEEMFEPLEKELDALKAEFAKMMDSDDDEGAEESANPFEDAEPKDADTIVKEYANMVKDGHGAEKKGSETGADNKKSPVAKKNKPVNNASPVKMDQGGEEQGGVGKALTGDTAKPMGGSYKNTGGINKVSTEKTPAPQNDTGSTDKSPVATK